MRTELFRNYIVEAAHRLPNVPSGHKCARLHGHSFKITLHIGGEVDPKSGWIIDFGEVDQAFAPLFEQLDHHYLNEVAGLENPTSELLARWVLERVHLSGARLLAVTIDETCNARCTVYADER